jgi:hypothetical protein
MTFVHYLRGYWPENRWGRLAIVIVIAFVLLNVAIFAAATWGPRTYGHSETPVCPTAARPTCP